MDASTITTQSTSPHRVDPTIGDLYATTQGQTLASDHFHGDIVQYYNITTNKIALGNFSNFAVVVRVAVLPFPVLLVQTSN